MRIGMPELVVLLVVVMLIFGVGKLPEMGSTLGKAIREFKRGMEDVKVAASGEEPAGTKASRGDQAATPSEERAAVDKKV